MEALDAKKILIVDDEAYMRRLVEQTLEDLEDRGVEILVADNGETAWELAKNEIPQLIFLDVMLPRMNGFEVCRKIKDEESLVGTYVVILTAKGQEYDRELANAAGADQYLTKPFDPDEVLIIAQSILGV